MPTALQGRTRAQLMVPVLYNLGAVREITASGNGSTTTFLFREGNAAASDFVDFWLKFLAGANTSGHSQVTASSAPSSGVVTLTFAPAATSTLTDDTALLVGWEGQSLPPERVYAAINQAIVEATGYVFDSETSLALHAYGQQTRYDIPSEFAMLARVDVRTWVQGVQIHACDTAWDEDAVPSNVTRSVDTEDKRHGGGSVRFIIAGAFATGKVSSDAISSLDLRRYTHIEFWIKSTIATTAGDFQIVLDDADAAGDGTDLENLAVPALVADTWTFVRVALANPETDSAIISVGLRAVNNIAANTIWVDDVKAVVDSEAVWGTLHRDSWSIDQENRDLVLKPFNRAGYALLKLVGGDKPALLAADSDVTEVPEDYIIARATALLLMSGLGAPGLESQARSQQAGFWATQAEQAKKAMTMNEDVRDVSG